MKATANGDMETVDIVVKLARFYRLSLSNGSDFLPLSDEAEHVRLFVELTNLSRGRTMELHHENRSVYCRLPHHEAHFAADRGKQPVSRLI